MPEYRIEQDEDPMSPLEWDLLGTIVCCHKNYDLGHRQGTVEEIQEIAADSNNICLPVFMIDHSGISINTTGFRHCDPQGWDWGQVGIIYATKEKANEEFQKLPPLPEAELQAVVENILRSEIKTYDKYLRGEAYGYVVFENKKCDCCGHVEEVILDSCWGFYSEEDAEKAAQEAIETTEITNESE